MSQLTPAGFTAKTLRDVLGEIETSEKDNIDPAVDVASTRPLGQLNGVYADREAALWELLRLAFSAFDPDQAEGYLLDALCALTGTTRRPASRSLVPAICSLDAGAYLPAGSLASVNGQPTRRFRSRARFPTSGTVATAGDYEVQFEAENTGPIPANAGTLTVIAGPVAGWNAVTNLVDAEPGINEDTDAILRTRRASELQSVGGSTPDAIRSDLLKLSGVLLVTVFENLSDTENSDGMPPHSIEVLVYDGVYPSTSNDKIAQAIWDSRAGGVTTYGNSSGTAVDSEGNNQTVYFSRPVPKNVYLDITVDTEGTTPAGAANLLRDYVVAKGNLEFNPGDDVIALALKCILLDTKKDLGYKWVNDVPTLKLGFSASPSGTANLAISVREIARLDTSRTTVTLD